MILNSKDLIHDTNFPLSNELLHDRYSEYAGKYTVHEIKFIIFIDTKDEVSKAFTKNMILDLEGVGVELVLIDMYKLDDLTDNIVSLVKTCTIGYFPYMILIPDNKVRRSIFNGSKVVSRILETLRELLITVYKDPVLAEELLYLSDMDSLYNNAYLTSYKKMNFKTLANMSNIHIQNHLVTKEIDSPSIVVGILLTVLYYLNNFNSRCTNPLNSKCNLQGVRVAILSRTNHIWHEYLVKAFVNLQSIVTSFNEYGVLEDGELDRYDVVISCIDNPEVIKLKHLGTSRKKLLMNANFTSYDNDSFGDFAQDTNTDNHVILTNIGKLTRMSVYSNLINTSGYIKKKIDDNNNIP